MQRPVLVSGIQPSGRLHIGNYLGALKNFVDLQNSGNYRCYFFVADLHSLTEPFRPENILELTADYLAAGLDPKKSVIFQQSQVPAVSELTWILSTLTPFGELKRMTQFKEKSQQERQRGVNAGLFLYPLLMASDIFLYSAAFVPVGDDQLQHLELARTIARRFNKRYGRTFIEPKALMTNAPRVMSLDNPTKKMSKSIPKGCLFLDDPPSEIERKLRRAVTDSGTEIIYNPEKKPAISNLITIYAELSGAPVEKIAAQWRHKGYAAFKKALASLVAAHFTKFRARKRKLLAERAQLLATLRDGSRRAARTARKKIAEVQALLGLRQDR
ncbi:tryptophan--tRNA ligase [Candidatus Parcubacteria bacterium]|nr:MAG: tryptophan--tRNA ligase [Candidatus Parcubacteria bacterium]